MHSIVSDLVVTISTTAAAAVDAVAAIIAISALLLFYFNEFDDKTNLIPIQLLLLPLLLLKMFGVSLNQALIHTR